MSMLTVFVNVVPYVGTWIEILRSCSGFRILNVVPYVGTWIEMIRSAATSCACWSRSLRGNVDRNALRPLILSANSCRSLRGNVDRNRTEEEHHSGFQGRSLRGNVDRNVSVLGHAFTSTSVVPYVGTWIEIVLLASPAVYSLVVPYVGTWIEISNSKLPPPCFCGRSLRGNVDRNYRHCSDKCNRNGRSLRGNVDRNGSTLIQTMKN